jgi:hypothetical protein
VREKVRTDHAFTPSGFQEHALGKIIMRQRNVNAETVPG